MSFVISEKAFPRCSQLLIRLRSSFLPTLDTSHVCHRSPGRAMPRFIYTSGSVRCLTNRIIHSDNMNRMASAPLKWRSIDLPPPSGFGRPRPRPSRCYSSSGPSFSPRPTHTVHDHDRQSVMIICSLSGRENTCTFAVLYNIKRTTE